MEIDPQIAQAIVTNIKDVIRHEINLFDTNGIIVASTDASRIGTGHDGARLAVQIKQTVSIDDEHQFEGARNGINVPVLFDDSVVAVIGITGVREEVEPFGNVIKKMTEILIRENLEQVTRFDQRLMMTNLTTMLTQPRRDEGLAAYLSSTLGVDLKRPRRAAVGRPMDGDDAMPTPDSLYMTLRRHMERMPHTLYSVTAQECCLLIDDGDCPDPTSTLAALQTDIEHACGQRIGFGIGETTGAGIDYRTSYDQACVSVSWQQFTGRDGIASYDDLGDGVLVSSIPPDSADQFVDYVFAGLTDEQIDAFAVTFDAYTRHNGSIVHAADELFLHKNTLQNRLNKIFRETGYNPRELADYAILSLAFRIRDHRAFQQRRSPAPETGRGSD